MDVLRLVGIQVAGEECIVIAFSVEICVVKCVYVFCFFFCYLLIRLTEILLYFIQSFFVTLVTSPLI